jgi:hypothetical protein
MELGDLVKHVSGSEGSVVRKLKDSPREHLGVRFGSAFIFDFTDGGGPCANGDSSPISDLVLLGSANPANFEIEEKQIGSNTWLVSRSTRSNT